MQLGMIGAGRMGGHMVIRLMKAGHTCVVYARHQESIQDAMDHGAKGTTDLKEFVGMLEKPRAVWLMVPAAAVDKVLDDLIPMLNPSAWTPSLRPWPPAWPKPPALPDVPVSPPPPKTAICTAAPAAAAISSKWSTTALNTASWRPSPKA
jgi:hypothetical protein